MAYADLRKRALLVTILERLDQMAANLTAIRDQVTALQAVVVELKPAVDAAQELATRAIAAIEDLGQRVAALEPNAAEIAALAESVGATVASLQTESAEQQAANAALQAKLDAIPPAPVA